VDLPSSDDAAGHLEHVSEHVNALPVLLLNADNHFGHVLVQRRHFKFAKQVEIKLNVPVKSVGSSLDVNRLADV